MKRNSSFFPIAIFAAAVLLLPFPAAAVTRVVAKTSGQCPPVTATTICYLSFQDAVTPALAGDSIEFLPGMHSVANATVNKSLSIYGIEAARTILNGGGAGTILTISGVSAGVSIRDLTFFSANTAVAVQNSSSVDIRNNIFEAGSAGTAVTTVSSPSTRIFNNTFYLNGKGIETTDVNLSIFNNAFYQSSGATAISPAMNLLNIKNNLFFGGIIGPPSMITVNSMPFTSDPSFTNVDWKGNVATLDPSFVFTGSTDVTLRDFHLLASSPCITSGDTSMGFINNVGDTSKTDIGAYGGQSDRIPFIVSGVSGVASASTGTVTDTITLSWSPNNAYTTKGYNVYYGQDSGYTGTDALVSGVTRTSPIDVGMSTSVVLTGLITSTATPTAPVLAVPEPRNESLRLSWSAVPGATSYTIYYSLVSAPSLTFPPVAVTNTSYLLPGLTNGVLYSISITAQVQTPYYLAVTAYDLSSTAGTPGELDESAFSAEQRIYVGTPGISGLSNAVIGMPEMIVPNPNLPNTGCFIATAAYGSASDSAVLVLREFRDRRLLTSGPGRAFIRWYYEHSPAAAQFLNDHPVFKPAVRAALAPVVAVALFLIRTPAAAQIAVLLLLAALAVVLLRKMRAMRSRSSTKGTF